MNLWYLSVWLITAQTAEEGAFMIPDFLKLTGQSERKIIIATESINFQIASKTEKEIMKKPKHHYCHRAFEDTEQFSSLSNNMEILEKIGEGSFGQVYKVLDTLNSRLLVLKKSKEDDDLTIIEEAQIMKQLSGSEGFRRVAENSRPIGKSLLMSCLGTNLGTIIRKRSKMSVFSVRKIAIQMIKNLEELHEHRYVHRDLKPQNILMGDKLDSHSVYLIDFGLVSSYRPKATKRRKLYKGLVGTAKFSSIASHQGYQQFPIDDLESLGYILVFFVCGVLPWSHEKQEDDEKLFSKILSIKKATDVEVLCGGFNCLRNFIKKVRQYEFNSKIDYNGLIEIFKAGCNMEALSHGCFDFCEDCWVQKADKREGKKVEQEPRPNSIRISILD